MNITTISKRKSLDYRDFIRDENNNLVHKSKIKKNNTSISGSNNNKKESK